LGDDDNLSRVLDEDAGVAEQVGGAGGGGKLSSPARAILKEKSLLLHVARTLMIGTGVAV